MYVLYINVCIPCCYDLHTEQLEIAWPQSDFVCLMRQNPPIHWVVSSTQLEVTEHPAAIRLCNRGHLFLLLTLDAVLSNVCVLYFRTHILCGVVFVSCTLGHIL